MIVKVQQKDFITQNEIDDLKNRCKEIPGAITSFVGYVRDYSNGERITSLNIEHYPGMTEKKLMEISQKASKKWPLLGSLVIHRYGKLNTSDQIVLAAAASLHRKAAFEASVFMMDYLKTSAPFWKSEIVNDSEVWVEAKLEDEIAKKKWQ
jgi:molybdopterin synthase catalytic subunit